MPEENKTAGNLLQTQQEANEKASQQQSLYQTPQYNPLLGVTPRKFQQVMAGNNPNAPLVSSDAYGYPTFHFENIEKQGPAEIKLMGNGVHEVKGVKEAMDKNVTELSNHLGSLVAEIAPELNKDNQQSNKFKQALVGVENFISETPKSAGSIILNSIHGIQSMARNYQEMSWDIFHASNENKPAFNEAGLAYKQAEDAGYSSDAILNPANIEKMAISDDAKQVLYRYKELQDARRADERRMQISAAYDSDMTNVQEFANKLLKPTDADQESMFAMLGNMTGNVVGSLAVYWTAGRLTGGLVGGTAKALGLAGQGGVEASLALAASAGEKAVFAPSFLSQYNQVRTQALMAGKSIGEANAIGFMAGVAEGGLEFAGFKFFKRFYRSDGIIRTYLLQNILPEALQEGSQTLAENIITQHFGVTDKQWTDIMSEIGLSMVAGAMGGGLFTAGRMRYNAAMAYLGGIREDLQTEIATISKEDVNVGVRAVEAKAAIEEDTTLKPEQKEQAKKDYMAEYRNLLEDQKKAADAYETAYNQLKDYYTQEAKRFTDNKITQEQLANGWRAIRAMINLQRDGNVLVESFHDSVNKMVAYLNKTDEQTKRQMENVKNELFHAGFEDEQVKALTSKQAIEKNEAKWDLAEKHLTREIARTGASEAEAGVTARFIRNMLKESTLINPHADPMAIVKAMHANTVNVNHAIFYKKDLPALFAPISDSFKKDGYLARLDSEQARQFAFDVADALEAKEVLPTYAADINNKLYGDRDADPNLDRLRALAVTQSEMVRKTVEKMPSQLNTDLPRTAFTAMWLMHEFGYGWGDVFEQFGVNGATEEGFNKTAKRLYREPQQNELDNLATLADGIEDTQLTQTYKREGREEAAFNKEQIEGIESGASFYDADSDLLVLNRTDPGTALHEYGHFSMTYLMAQDLQLRRMGLLDDSSALSAMWGHLAELMQRDGRTLTETAFQETVNDAVRQYIDHGQVQDPVLSGLINQMKEEGFNASKKLMNSLLTNRRAPLEEGQKERIISNVGAILEGVTPSSMLQEAMALQEMSALRNMPEDQKAGQGILAKLADATEAFLKNRPTENADKNIELLKMARKANNFLAVAEVANMVATDAINMATDFFIQGKDLENEFEGTKYLMNRMDEGIFFERFENDGTISAGENFREEKPLAQQIKEAVKKAPGIMELIVGTGKKYLQSAEGAAGDINNELRSILMREAHAKEMNVQKFREKLAPVVNKMDSYLDKLPKAERNKEAAEWRKEFQAVLGSSQLGGYQKSIDFIERKLGKESAKQWASVIEELKSIKSLLIAAGLPKQLFAMEGDFFPMAVADFNALTKDHFGHSHTYNFVEKERGRIIEEYKKAHDIKNLKPEEEAQLDVLITDAINSQFQRNTTDENKVTSFMRRKIFDYTKDPSILKYYYDPFSTLDRYMNSAYTTIMMRNLIGKTTFNEDGSVNMGEGETGKVGRYLNQVAGYYPADVVENFWAKMRSLSQRDSGARNDALEMVRTINQITTLGSPFSTLNQVQDLEFCFTMFGIKATTDAISQVIGKDKKAQKLTDVGAQPLNEMFRVEGRGTLQKIAERVFKATGFEWTDKAVKEVILNATTNYAKDVLQKTASNKKLSTSDARDLAQLNYIINECFPPADGMSFPISTTPAEQARLKQEREAIRNQVKRDLMEGNSTEDTRYIQWYMLTKLQPQNAFSVPAVYNTTNSFGKLCYQFTTVAVRQMGFMADYWKMQAQIGGSKTQAAIQMAKLAAFCIGIGIPKEAVEAILRGQKPDIYKGALMSPLHVIMVNEYTLSVIKNEGPFRGAITTFQPGFAALDNIGRDFLRMVSFKPYKGYTFKSVPVVGLLAWHWWLGGSQQAKKEGKNLFGGTYDPKEARKAKADAQNAVKAMEDF